MPSVSVTIPTETVEQAEATARALRETGSITISNDTYEVDVGGITVNN